MVQIVAWHGASDKPLAEPMVVSLLTDAYVSHALIGLSGLN